ncbi:MAG: hypothetical protein K2H52_10020 [Lachnospiraceae bacterium]|nr:hypothetical protein [Lachnospiraceae bacterium]
MKGIIQVIYRIWNNDVFGFILRLSIAGLLLYVITLLTLCFVNRFLFFHNCKKAAKVLRNVLKCKKAHMLITVILGGGLLISPLICLFDLSMAQEQEYIYIHTELAEQKDINRLFPKRISESESDAWKESESLLKLHVEEGFLNAEISKGMFKYYKDLFSKIYGGTKIESDEGTEVLEKQNEEMKTYFSINNGYLSEARGWKDQYESNGDSASLYQYGRALNDAAMTIGEIPFMVMLEIAADAISSEEKFLSYDDRNINGDEPIIINAENVSLMNGKLYLYIAIRAEAGGEEEKSYINCFLVEAYTCIEQGRLQIDTDDELYALLTYYLGNIGETMLWKIPVNDNLYKVIGNEALENYENALELIENNPDFYIKEDNMEKNINDGIATLNQLGFSLEEETKRNR